MSLEPKLIANFRVALDLSMESWLGPEQAVSRLENLYPHRGRFVKRNGKSVFGQTGDFISGEIGFTNVTGNRYTKTLASPVVVRKSVRIYDSGSSIVVRDDGQGNLTGNVDPAGTNTINYDTGAVDVTFDAAIVGTVTAEYHQEHARAIRGIYNFDRYSGSDVLVAFDTHRMSKWNTTNDFFENISDSGGNYALWSSSNLVWTASYGDYLWICDNSTLSAGTPPTGGIKVFDGSQISDPTLDLDGAGTAVKGCLMIFVYKDRLVLLNTIEGASNTRHPQRARWSEIGVTPTTVNGWYDPELSGVFGKGGRNDAPTNDEIVSAGFVGERLIVLFENSVYALDATSNPDTPFVWTLIARTRQCSATFSTIEYDNFITTMGGKGLIACQGNRVFEFDDKIPDFVFSVDQDNVTKTCSIRDDRRDYSLMSYPDVEGSGSNDMVLGYNYNDNAFFQFDLGVHCFGSWLTAVDRTFDSYSGTTYDELAGTTWGEPSLQAGFPIILGGGDSGYVFRLNDTEALADSSTWKQYYSESSQTPTNFGFDLITKRLNPYKSQKVYLSYVQFMVSRNDAEFTCDFIINQDNQVVKSVVIDCSNSVSAGDKVWVTVPAEISANFVRMRLYLTPSQISAATAKKQVEIHAMMLWTRPDGRLEEL